MAEYNNSTSATVDSNDTLYLNPIFWSIGHQVPYEPWAFTIKQTIVTLLCAFGIFSNLFII
ncbi:alpha-1A adrenergic receptor, partial [Biomphalaria pfeifferi]